MTLDTVGYKTLSLWHRKQVGRVLSKEEILTVEHELETLWSMYSVQFRTILLKNDERMDVKKGLRTPMFILGQSFVCYTDSADVDGISGETYWRYRAITDILCHVMMWCHWTWKGKKKTWEQMDNILYTLGAKPLTQQFVRNDLFYKGAVQEQNAGVFDSNKLVLDTYRTFECRQGRG